MSTISSVLPRWHNCWVRFTCGKSDVRIPSLTDRSQQSNAWQQACKLYSNTVVRSYEKQHSGVIPHSTCSRGRSAGGALTERWRSAGDRGCSSHRHWRGQGDELSGLMNGQILSQDLSPVKTELFEHVQKKLTCIYKQTDKATWPPKILSMLFTVSAYPLIALHKADDYPYRVHVL